MALKKKNKESNNKSYLLNDLNIIIDKFRISNNNDNKRLSEIRNFKKSSSEYKYNKYFIMPPDKINLDELNEYSKKAPFNLFKLHVEKEAFLKEAKLLEPVLIAIFHFAYYIIFFLLKLSKSPIVSSLYPKPLKNKLSDLDVLIKKYHNLNNKMDLEKDNYFKMILDCFYIINIHHDHNKKVDFDMNTIEELQNQALNMINCLLIFFQRLPKKSKRVIRGSQGILEILVHLLVYKNYLDSEKTKNRKLNTYKICNNNDKNNDDNETLIIKAKKINDDEKIEKNFAQKLISVLNNFDKITVFKTIIMMIDLNKSNKRYLRIITKLNTLVALKSYNNLMCLFNVFDLSNLNFDTTTKLVKKLFSAIPESIKKQTYFVKLIDCYWDLIIILKNRDTDEKLCGVKEFAINIFGEIINNFCDDLDFALYLFHKIFNRFFRLFG